MGRALPALAGLLILVGPAWAGDEGVQVSVGYSFVKYLEEGGGSAPVGAFLSLSGRKDLSLEVDLGWQRDTEGDIALNTFTATAGPRFEFGSGDGAKPFVHALGGVRHDRIEGESNSAWGGFVGGGVDIKAGERVAVRLGADFQMFFDEGENVKTLRLGVGFTF